nr:carbon-nitrogen hydrolase family protein [Lachnospiraceae bacterium]
MKIVMAQMSMVADKEANYQKAVKFIRNAEGADLILFPESLLTPFFARYEKEKLEVKTELSKEGLSIPSDHEIVKGLLKACEKHKIYAFPNIYVTEKKKNYSMTFAMGPDGKILGKSKLVHVSDGPRFHEKDYYTPSEEGFKVYDLPFGKVGVVIGFDRHMPESIRTCAVKGAELIIISAANVKDEPLHMFERELMAQAFQNNVFIAMCNRVGTEGDLEFAGQSLVIDPDGHILLR